MTDIPALQAAYASAGAALNAAVAMHKAALAAATSNQEIAAIHNQHLPLIRAAGKAHFEASKAHQIAIREKQIDQNRKNLRK